MIFLGTFPKLWISDEVCIPDYGLSLGLRSPHVCSTEHRDGSWVLVTSLPYLDTSWPSARHQLDTSSTPVCHQLDTSSTPVCNKLATSLPQAWHWLVTSLPKACHQLATSLRPGFDRLSMAALKAVCGSSISPRIRGGLAPWHLPPPLRSRWQTAEQRCGQIPSLRPSHGLETVDFIFTAPPLDILSFQTLMYLFFEKERKPFTSQAWYWVLDEKMCISSLHFSSFLKASVRSWRQQDSSRVINFHAEGFGVIRLVSILSFTNHANLSTSNLMRTAHISLKNHPNFLVSISLLLGCCILKQPYSYRSRKGVLH